MSGKHSSGILVSFLQGNAFSQFEQMVQNELLKVPSLAKPLTSAHFTKQWQLICR